MFTLKLTYLHLSFFLVYLIRKMVEKLKKRTFSAMVLLLILVVSLIISSKLFSLIMLLCAIIGFNELFTVKYKKRIKELDVIKILAFLSVTLITLNNIFYVLDTKVLILLPLLLLSIPIIFYNNSEIYNITDCMYILGSIYFLGFAFGNIVALRNINIYQCVYIFIISFITDTYAYIGGSLIGRHKLTSISPKKTIEGSLIGTFMGVVAGTVYYYNVVGNLTLLKVIILSFSLTIISEIGDLVFSSIKRYFGTKDYSNLIPGHGGILDRFDSVIYVSLCMSLLLSIL